MTAPPEECTVDRDGSVRFAEIDGYLAEMDRRLVTIARQNAALGEMVEVLGGYVNVSLDRFQQHLDDGH